MPVRPQPPLSFKALHMSPLVRIHDYVCCAPQGGPGGEEPRDANTIVLMRNGAFSKHMGRRSVTADVNQAVFFTKGSTCRVGHPMDGGDRGTVFEVTPRVLNDIIRELDPTIDQHPDRPFPFETGPCGSDIFRRHRDLVMKLETKDETPLEPLWADSTALQLAADVLEAAFGSAGRTAKPAREVTDSEHEERVEAAKAHLAAHLGDRLTLDDVAKTVAMSPFHFTRVFQQRTGVPIHRYLMQLRLRASLERLSQGESDLTKLALDLGFSSHSHFTGTFKREFGETPAAFRKSRTGKSARIRKSRRPSVS